MARQAELTDEHDPVSRGASLVCVFGVRVNTVQDCTKGDDPDCPDDQLG